MHKTATSRHQSPLEKIMMDIKDTSIDIMNIADWLNDPQYGGINSTRARLNICSDRLNAAYDRLRELTGAHPCK